MTASARAALGCFRSVCGEQRYGRTVCPIDRRHILQRHPSSIDDLGGCCRFRNRRGRQRMAVASVRLGSRRRDDEACNHEGQDRQRPRQKHFPVHLGPSTTKRRLFRSCPSQIMVPIVGRSRVNAKYAFSHLKNTYLMRAAMIRAMRTRPIRWPSPSPTFIHHSSPSVPPIAADAVSVDP
jgi:hypothetical protein